MKILKLAHLGVLNFLLIVLIFIYLIFAGSAGNSRRVAVIDKARLFNEFKMTKEVANQINIRNNGFKVQYDSLNLKYNNTMEGAERAVLSQRLKALQSEIENLNVGYREQETLKIWKRIQSYASDYLDDKKYDLILGAESNGDVVGFKEKLDVTNELLFYLNKRYEGDY